MKLDVSKVQAVKLLENSSLACASNPFKAVDEPILQMDAKAKRDLYEEWLDSYGGVTADSCDGPSYGDGGY